MLLLVQASTDTWSVRIIVSFISKHTIARSAHIVLLQVTEHDHCRHTLIHHHLPEVSNCILHGTLSYDECLFTITLHVFEEMLLKEKLSGTLTFTKLA